MIRHKGTLKTRFEGVLTPEDKKMRLPWWGVLCVVLGTILIAFLFDFFGAYALARPALFSAAMIVLAVVMRWQLRRHVWFWVAITIFMAIHILLILLVPWTTRWIPAFAIAPFGVLDLYAMLWVILVVGRYANKLEDL